MSETTLSDVIKRGGLIYKIQLQSRRRGMSDVDYLTYLLELDSATPLKTFATMYKGTVVSLAESLGVRRDTIFKWRSGTTLTCGDVMKRKILKLYGVKIK